METVAPHAGAWIETNSASAIRHAASWKRACPACPASMNGWGACVVSCWRAASTGWGTCVLAIMVPCARPCVCGPMRRNAGAWGNWPSPEPCPVSAGDRKQWSRSGTLPGLMPGHGKRKAAGMMPPGTPSMPAWAYPSGNFPAMRKKIPRWPQGRTPAPDGKAGPRSRRRRKAASIFYLEE